MHNSIFSFLQIRYVYKAEEFLEMTFMTCGGAQGIGGHKLHNEVLGWSPKRGAEEQILPQAKAFSKRTHK